MRGNCNYLSAASSMLSQAKITTTCRQLPKGPVIVEVTLCFRDASVWKRLVVTHDVLGAYIRSVESALLPSASKSL